MLVVERINPIIRVTIEIADNVIKQTFYDCFIAVYIYHFVMIRLDYYGT